MIFLVTKNEDFGELGFVPERLANQFDPIMSGLTVAHDCIEHFPNDDDSISAEARALGAIYYIRGETGYFSQLNTVLSPVAHMGSVIQLTFEYHQKGEAHIFYESIPKTKKLDDEIEEEFAAIIQYGIKSIIEESEHSCWDKPTRKELSYARKLFLANMRIGYRKAKKRFPDQHGALSLFYDIEKKVKHLIKRHTEFYEGMKLSVTFDKKTYTANVRLIFTDEYGEEYDF